MPSKPSRAGKAAPRKAKAAPAGVRKTAKDIQRECRQMLSIFDGIEEAIYVADPETYEILFVNRALRKMLESEAVGKKCYRALQGRKAPCPFCTNKIIRKIKPATYRWEHENPVLKRTYSLHDRIISWPDGREARLELAVDITDRKRTENELKESEIKYREIFDSPAEAIVISDARTGRVLDVNETTLRLFGLESKEEALSLAIEDVSPGLPFTGDEARMRMSAAAAGTPQQFEWLIRRKDGSEIPVEITLQSSQIRGENRLLAVIRDITRRKQAEDALRENERRLATLLSNLPGMVYRCRNDREWTMEFVSEGCRALTGYAPWVLMGADRIPYADVIHPEDRGTVWDTVQEALKDRRPFRIKYRILTAEGSEKWVWEQGRGVFGAGGEVIALEGFIADITEQTQAEEALNRNKALLDTAGRMARFGGWSLRLDEDRVSWSEEVVRIHEMPPGFSPRLEEAFAFYAPEGRGKIIAALRECVQHGIPYDGEYEIITAGGRRVWVRTSGEAVRDESGAVVRVEGAFQDITDRKRAEEQIRTALAEKDALLRELYHRTKNNMDVIRAMLTLKAAFRKDDRLREFVKEIDQKILAMAMAHEKLYQARDLSRIHLDEYLADLASLQMHGCDDVYRRIVLRMDFDRVDVLIDTAIPCGLVLNELLCNSAKFAFPGGRKGEIRIRLTRNPEGLIELDYADDGVGFPEGSDIREQNGLGLKILFDIVENQLMGTIRFDGRRGAAVEIRFNDNLYSPRVTA